MTPDEHTKSKCNDRFNTLEKAVFLHEDRLQSTADAMKSIKDDMDRFFKLFDGFSDFKFAVRSHIEESDKPKGFRDVITANCREILLLRKDIEAIKKVRLRDSIIGGVVGGLIVAGSPEIMGLVLRLLIR